MPGGRGGEGGRRLTAATAVGVLVGVAMLAGGLWLGTKRHLDPFADRRAAARAGDAAAAAPAAAPAEAAPEPLALASVSPRLLSNAASYPLLVTGAGFAPGDALVVEGPGPEVARVLPTAFLDAHHLTARLPAATAIPTQHTFATLRAHVRRADGARTEGDVALTVVNDATYPVPFALASDARGTRLFVASPTTDAVWTVRVPADGPASAPEPIPVGDGPRALARWVDPAGREQLVVAHGLAPELWVLPMDEPAARPRVIRVAATELEDVAVPAGRDEGEGGPHLAFVTARGSDAVHVVRLTDGLEVGRAPVGVNPGPIAVAWESWGEGAGTRLLTGNAGSDDVTWRDVERGPDGALALERGGAIAFAPGAAILGGHTEPYAGFVMGGKAPRDVVAFGAGPGAAFFASSLGPNVGPNPARLDVSMNGGVSVYPVAGPPRHVSMGQGQPVGLAVGGGVLFVADVGRGRVLAFDAAALAAGSEAAARRALLATAAMPTPPDVALLRPAEQLGVGPIAGPEVHAGPWAVVASADGSRAWVLARFTGAVVELDARRVRAGALEVRRVLPVVPLRAQPQRRFGEVSFHTDLADTRMSCDGCHPDGREGGILFTKKDPMHVYRAPSLLSIGESPPFFTPAMIPTLEATAEIVLDRNRASRVPPDAREIRALGLYQAALVAPPNPLRGPKGELPERLPLPGGGVGSPARGLAVFEGAGACAECHPAPAWTTDQSDAARGERHDVGTPIAIALRLEQQDHTRYPLPPTSLVALWDRYPLLQSGAAGFDVVDDRIEATREDAIERVLELGVASRAHGGLHELDEDALRDLAAFLRAL